MLERSNIKWTWIDTREKKTNELDCQAKSWIIIHFTRFISHDSYLMIHVISIWKIFNLKSDWLFLCDSDLPLVIARNMTVWDKFGSYEYASNYCQSKNSKIGHKSELVIFYGHLEFKPEFRHLTFLIAHGSWGHIQCEKFLSSNWEFILDAHQTDLDRESCIQQFLLLQRGEF